MKKIEKPNNIKNVLGIKKKIGIRPNMARENITCPTSYSLVIFIKTSISEKKSTLKIIHIPPSWF